MAKTKIRWRNRFAKKRHNGKKGFTLPISVVAGMAPGLVAIGTSADKLGWEAAARTAGLIYTGWDYTTGKFNIKNMSLGFMPIAVGMIVHKVAGMLGINKAIAAAGIPVFRI